MRARRRSRTGAWRSWAAWPHWRKSSYRRALALAMPASCTSLGCRGFGNFLWAPPRASPVRGLPCFRPMSAWTSGPDPRARPARRPVRKTPRSSLSPEVGQDAEVVGGERVARFDVEDQVVAHLPAGAHQDRVEAADRD